jgi:hypothetical protein
VHADHVGSPAAGGGEHVHVERRRVGGNDRTGFAYRPSLAITAFLMSMLEHGFDEQVAVLELRVVERTAAQGHALFDLAERHPALLAVAS